MYSRIIGLSKSESRTRYLDCIVSLYTSSRSQSGNVSFYELRLLRDALVLSIKALNVDVAQLPAQLYGRLMPFINHGNTKR